MLDPTFTGPFKKDRKLVKKRNKEYKGKRECHVEPDWLLIYRVDKDNRRIIFYRTGSHSDLY